MIITHKILLNLGFLVLSYFFNVNNIEANENKDQPEKGYSKQIKGSVTSNKFMVSTANPIATNTGIRCFGVGEVQSMR